MDRVQFVIAHICMIFEYSMVNLNEEVDGQDKKDAHLTADMGSHLLSLFQALLPEQFDRLFIIIHLHCH